MAQHRDAIFHGKCFIGVEKRKSTPQLEKL
jgi:hypothetical protein